MDLDSRIPTLDRIVDRAASRRDTTHVRFAASVASQGWSWGHAAPDAAERYFAASITKLVTTAIVLQHVDEHRYSLETRVATLLAPGTLDGLLVLDGRDRGGEITIEQLLSHTSGLADYFEGRPANGPGLYERMLQEDTSWGIDTVLEIMRGATPHGPPGEVARAHYSDTNFRILQLVIEVVDGAPYAHAASRRVLDPLGLTRSFVFTPETLDTYAAIAPVLHGSRTLTVPRAMASFGADGSLVSTAAEQVALLDAFMAARLFSPELLARITDRWRPMFFPLEYGVGMMRFRLPRAYNPWSPMPPLVGHSGATGAVLFHDPDRGLTIAGTVNQLKKRSLAFQVLGRLERALR